MNYSLNLIFVIFFIAFKLTAQTDFDTAVQQYNAGQISSSIQRFQTVLEKDSSRKKEIFSYLANAHKKMGQLTHAKSYFEKLSKLEPQNTVNFLNLAELYEKTGNLNRSYQYLKKLQSLDSNNALYYRELARIAQKTNKPDSSIIFYKRAVFLNPQDLESVTELAFLYLNRSEDELANPLISSAFKLDSNAVKVRHLKARQYFRAFDYENYIREIEYTMQLGDSTAYYQRLLGNCYFNLAQYDKAVAVFERLITNDDKNEQVYSGLAFAQLRATTEDKTNLFNAHINFQNAIDYGTSDRLSDYQMGLAECANLRAQNTLGYMVAIKMYKDILEKYQRPKATLEIARIHKNSLCDNDMALIYYEEYIRQCKAEKRKTTDCNELKTVEAIVKSFQTDVKSQEKPSIKPEKLKLQTEADSVKR